jgi:hypothetical protein
MLSARLVETGDFSGMAKSAIMCGVAFSQEVLLG